jgi:hypothetical protein
MTDYSLPVITVTSPLQRTQKILAREQRREKRAHIIHHAN